MAVTIAIAWSCRFEGPVQNRTPCVVEGASGRVTNTFTLRGHIHCPITPANQAASCSCLGF